ncbi:MAG: flagellar hook-basal body complex protein FliE [Verrucomicrobiota bacterium]|nr:flagellar hook-basal body complex protein FliE [Verrucomicrobiota bacterium]
MNPLSVYRSMAVPDLRNLPQIQPGMDELGKIIPQNELQKLGESSPLGGSSLISRAMPVAEGGSSFSGVLGQMVSDVSSKQAEASEMVNGLLRGENVSLHQTMLAVEEASVSFQLMVEVRNKLLESYQELMRMQI